MISYRFFFFSLLCWIIFPLHVFSETFTYTFPAGYNLFSLPFTPTVKSINSLGIEKPQIFTWDAQNKKFLTTGDNFQLEPGKGYWLWLDKETPISLEGSALTGDFTIPLKKGWNLIGNPLNKDIFVPNHFLVNEKFFMESSDIRDKKLYKFLGLTDFAGLSSSYLGSYKINLEKWKGYWIYAETDSNLTVKDTSLVCPITLHFKIKNNPRNIQSLQFIIVTEPVDILEPSTINTGALTLLFPCALGGNKKNVNCTTSRQNAIPANSNGEILTIPFKIFGAVDNTTKVTIKIESISDDSLPDGIFIPLLQKEISQSVTIKPNESGCSGDFDLLLDSFVQL